MKTVFLAIFGVLSLIGTSFAIMKEELNYVPNSSYTDVDTGGTVLFTSAPINLVGVTVASGALNSYLVIYRSTDAVFKPSIATQTLIDTNSLATFPQQNQFVPLFETFNDSYTYINKVGAAKITIWVRCQSKSGQRSGNCPGLPWNGQKQTKIEYP